MFSERNGAGCPNTSYLRRASDDRNLTGEELVLAHYGGSLEVVWEGKFRNIRIQWGGIVRGTKNDCNNLSLVFIGAVQMKYGLGDNLKQFIYAMHITNHVVDVRVLFSTDYERKHSFREMITNGGFSSTSGLII
jgi:hypothetical protein